ncbi:site-specific integrase [Mucilaginibacter sp. ZT4R22]|uniref:Site-specific integrase n=1 Tax=Mucilaginibacter pankratovii TaxID=2772110 RepID=A0ABR7WNN2_9SPHI|nr:tyrosine-type recombinase/integrase [Mucilaginibacter pankratovii]MBD1362912.1 site-specific integrase [Mucilaginibacter pankratovii]
MFTEPKIVSSNDLETRSYVTFYLNKKRVREYNGNCLNLTLNPNRAETITERNKLLDRLRYELHKALETEAYPASKLIPLEKPIDVINPTEALLREALNKKLESDLSKTYKRNLRLIFNDFISFLTDSELQTDIASISTVRIEKFLTKYKSSGTYYMNKRRDLGVLFSAAGRMIDQTLTSVKKTESRRVKARLHKAYDKEQLKPILTYLKENNYNMYLCCLITYSCWLRPHEEVRLLSRQHFRNNNSKIHLSGDENKSLKVRVVYIPDYVQLELNPILALLDKNQNIFSHAVKPFNDAYFNTQWKRAWNKMFDKGLVHVNQTIYSFRHTAAIDVFKRTKDVYLLQQMI